MNVPLVVAGSLASIAAVVHGLAGELVVVRKLSSEALPSSPFGGPGATKRMIRGAWHMTTIGFLTVGSALVLAGSVLQGDTARWIGLIAAAAASGFAAVAVTLALAGAFAQGPRNLFRHPAPIGLTAVAVLAWVGIS